MTSTLERSLRSAAYDVLSAKDGFHGWKAGQREFTASLAWSAKQLQRDAESKLAALLVHAYRTCPHYRDQWQQIGFRPTEGVQFSDLAKLPLLTKAVLRENGDRMVSTSFCLADLDASHTGGTSGTQVTFYRDHGCTVKRVGRLWGVRGLCGYTPGDRCGLVWGVAEETNNAVGANRLKHWLRNFASGQQTLCCAVLSPDRLRQYHHELHRFRPDVLYGYTNALAHLARFVDDEALAPIRVRRILCTAERLYDSQRRLMERVFGGEVFNLYCTREHGCIGFECEQHRGLHIDVGSVHVEVLVNDKPAPPGQAGQIAITDLLNYGMPFVRNKIGDWGRVATEPCECGSHLPLLSGLEGRDTDMIYRPDGSQILGGMIIDICWDLKEVTALQIVQKQLDSVELVLEVNEHYRPEVGEKAVSELRLFLGENARIELRTVDEIPRNPTSGKYQEVISKVRLPG